MKAWSADQGCPKGGAITMLADTTSALTNALGMEITHPGPCGALGAKRCKRFVLVIEDGIVTKVAISEAPDDPAGDNDGDGPITRLTLAETILAGL
ncbi:hypothetical protein M885DRAFT_508544 [Pelagophyceae sp. CCMP2097]|nr:hypothetical protein M885DRAFT_508544 [Pelagophyceae sp. CCMP2097]|mmetsp:Transcript_7558/g.24630  ORF Transcript_7558/g.24630 Transcript_7558/m.24630 type:complete len:96 (+) Transcript_7558:298-585(+)